MGPTGSSPSPTATAVRSIELMATGERADFAAVFAPDVVNHESAGEPPACRTGGPDAGHATSLWLRTAFEGLSFTVNHVAAQEDLVAVHTTMSGRHTGDFVVWTPEGSVERAWAPTDRTFAVPPDPLAAGRRRSGGRALGHA